MHQKFCRNPTGAKIFRPWSLELQTFSEVLDLSACRVPSGKDILFLEENTTIRISVLHNQMKSIIWNLCALFFFFYKKNPNSFVSV